MLILRKKRLAFVIILYIICGMRNKRTYIIAGVIVDDVDGVSLLRPAPSRITKPSKHVHSTQ